MKEKTKFKNKKIKIVPDTSVIIDGRITKILKKREQNELLKNKNIEILIPLILLNELENQANKGREIGVDGLNELRSLRQIAESSEGKIKVTFNDKGETGKSPDEIIRNVADKNNALIITSDKIQNLVSEVKGIETKYIGPKVKNLKPHIFDYFDNQTSSVHIKEDTKVVAKKGLVGNFKLVEVSENVIKRSEVEVFAKEVIEYTRAHPKGYVEMERRGATVVQVGNYRIVISRPPFSFGMEITAVKPIVKLKLSDYKISKNLLERLEKSAEGIFVAGPPGHGKTTFAAALAEFYLEKNKIVKTIEQPRDMQLPPEITQYAPLEGSVEKTSDILLLVRPDFTIFDEVRKTKDFLAFADLRLAGVGMIGVTHANKAIDAVQRFIKRVELGMIPHIIDTIIFIKSGKVMNVLELGMTVKVPYGMIEQDLSRPVIEVKDYESKELKYELYSYGEEVVVVPINKNVKKTKHDFAGEEKPMLSFTRKLIILRSIIHKNKEVSVLSNGRVIFTSNINRAGNMKINRHSKEGLKLLSAIKANDKITIE